MRFKDKVVLVIGGNSGIGLAAAAGFAEEGARLVITGRDPATLETAAGELGAIAVRCDVADVATIDACMAEVREKFGRIDVLFVNAGIGAFAPVRDVTVELWDQINAVNARGCFFAVQKALPLMGRGGSVVLTGSIGAVMPIPGNAIYAASKAALRAVARILGVELLADGIRVNMVSPGPTETPLINRNIGMSEAEVKALREMMISNIPMHRMGEPEEVARAVLFLASDEASFINGVDLCVDGGCVEL
jgi:NAD(P)-dependent dehydrogenase (short-subunit alcohol dehydrogenase family)